mgnify:CR=1 FL=1
MSQHGLGEFEQLVMLAVMRVGDKAYGVPIHSLLGGRFRDSVRMYADCPV